MSLDIVIVVSRTRRISRTQVPFDSCSRYCCDTLTKYPRTGLGSTDDCERYIRWVNEGRIGSKSRISRWVPPVFAFKRRRRWSVARRSERSTVFLFDRKQGWWCETIVFIGRQETSTTTLFHRKLSISKSEHTKRMLAIVWRWFYYDACNQGGLLIWPYFFFSLLLSSDLGVPIDLLSCG